MKRFLLALLAIGALVTGVSPAAAQWHRGDHGGRGYYWHHRYWHHRYGYYHGGHRYWRYR